MQKLSLLTFTRNHMERAYGLIEDLYDAADEIILIDSSRKEEREKLEKMKKEKKWSKLKVYYMVPLGFVELYRPYGLSKCKNDWVLYLDVDERISSELKNDIIKIINDSDCAAYNSVRYEDFNEQNGNRGLSTYQVRLIRKSKVRYKGIIDERPIVDGKTGMLDEKKYYIKHVSELMRHQFNEYYTTNKFSKYECMSYDDLNKRILQDLAKTRGVGESTIHARRLGRAISFLLKFYEKITFRDMGKEIAPFDYFMYWFMKSIVFGIKMRSISFIVKSFLHLLSPYGL